MPRGDGTGPMGMGPMTGRAAGYCAGYGVPGYANPVGGRGMGFGGGRGMGRGRGRGRGFGRGWLGGAAWGPAFGAYAAPYPPAYGAAYAPPPEVERDALQTQARNLEAALKEIRDRLDQIEADADGE